MYIYIYIYIYTYIYIYIYLLHMFVEMGEQTRFLDSCWENTKKWQFSKEGAWKGEGGKPP